MEKFLRSEYICRSGVNGLIKRFWPYTTQSLDSKSKNECLWFLNNGVTFLYLYLKRCEYNVRINNTDSALLNTVIHDLYLWISGTDLLNFAYDNTIRAADYTIEKLVCTLEWGSQSAISWFKINHKKKACNQLNKIGRT